VAANGTADGAVADPVAAVAVAVANSAVEPTPAVRSAATVAPRHQWTPATDPVVHQPTAAAETASTHPANTPRTTLSGPATAVVPTGGSGGTASSGSGSPTSGVTAAAGHLCPAVARRCERSTLDDHDAAIWRSERASTSPD